LEYPANKKYLKANPIKPEGEILLLAGDIIPFAEIEKESVERFNGSVREELLNANVFYTLSQARACAKEWMVD
jgi:hypothetical protein